MKYLASGRMANAVFILTFVVGSIIALQLFNTGVSTYRDQELGHAQHHLQQFVARYDIALQQTISRSSKLSQAISSNTTLAESELRNFIQLVYPKPQDVSDIYLLNFAKASDIQIPHFHFSPEIGLSLPGSIVGDVITPFLAQARIRNEIVVSPIIPSPTAQGKLPIFVIVQPIARPANQDERAYLITTHRVASLTQALPQELYNENYAYVLEDHEHNHYAYPDDKMLADIPINDAQRSDIPNLNVPLSILGQQWQLWVYPPNANLQPVDWFHYVYLTLAILGCLLVSYLLRSGLIHHRQLHQRFLDQAEELTNKQAQLSSTQAALLDSQKTAERALGGKTQFMTTLGHQIRTPVNGIIGMTDLCMQTELSLKQQDYLRKINASAQHLNAVLGDLSDYALLESGELRLVELPFSLHEVVDGLYAMLSKEAQDKGLAFNITVPHNVHCDLIGDSRRLSEIMLNLCINAIEHTTSGHIHLIMSAEQDQPTSSINSEYQLTFMVTDTGSGIGNDDISRLFNKGQPLSKQKNVIGGLGLSISQALCKLMGGEITASSQLGIGSCFTAQVKLKLNNLIITAPDHPKKLSKPQRVMVIDDNPISLTMLEHALTSMGATVSGYHFANDALDALIEEDQPDVILLDWVMPQMGGLAFLTRLQHLDKKITSRILVLTAYDGKSITRMTQHFTVERILSKPCRNEELFHIIEGNDTIPMTNTLESTLDGLVVIVAEDNMINQEIICELLTQEGATVIPANDGQHCIDELARAEHVDIILMDINMPIMDGLDALKVIRQDLAMKSLPIVALTANVLEQDKEKYLQQGMNEHLGKPYDRDQIVECILRLTHRD